MSCLPSSWSNTKRKVPVCTTSQKKQKRTRHDFSNKTHLETVISVLDKHLEHKASSYMELDNLEFDPILQSVPFVKMMQNIEAPHLTQNIVLVTREYEEKFLRECLTASEQQCVMGTQCECMMLDSEQPFIGVQFVLPDSLQQDANMPNQNMSDFGITLDMNPNSHVSNEKGMCLLCLRKTTQILFYQSIHRGIHINGIIQKHGNFCNQPGEYHRNAMLICPPQGPIQCMPVPIVAHQRSNYEVVKRQGMHWIVQKNVAFEDFP